MDKKDILHKAVKGAMPKSKPILYLARHGHTALNGSSTSVERIRGWVDVPLNEEGKEDAKDLAKVLKDKGIKKIYTSDLSRAADTAKTIGKATGLTPIKKLSLRPWNLGKMTGEPVKEVLSEMKDYQKHPNKEVPNGETWNEFLKRYLGELKKLLEEAKKDGPILAVAHYRNCVTAIAWEKAGIGNNEVDLKTLEDTKMDTGDMVVFIWDGKKWKIAIDSI